MEENVSKVRSFSTRREFYRQFRRKSYAQELWGRFVKNKTAVLGLAIFFVTLMLAILAPLLADYNSVVIKLNVSERLQKPGAGHIFGTDELGRDSNHIGAITGIRDRQGIIERQRRRTARAKGYVALLQ